MEELLTRWLKRIRLNESTISTVLGAMVIIVVGVLIFNYFKAGKVEEISFEEPEETEAILLETEDGQFVPENLPNVHKVEVGEDLWKISQKYYTSGYNWVDIAKANQILNPDHIVVGQEIKLPQVAVKMPQEKAEKETEVVEMTDQPISGDSYEVELNDSLWKISLRAYGDGYKWTEIAKENNLINPDYIEIGQELKLPR